MLSTNAAACRMAVLRPAGVDVDRKIAASGWLAFSSRISGMADATSPTETACNQMEPAFVRGKDRGRNPSRSVKWGR